MEKCVLADLFLTKLPNINVNSLYQCPCKHLHPPDEIHEKYQAYLDKQLLISPGWGIKGKNPQS